MVSTSQLSPSLPLILTRMFAMPHDPAALLYKRWNGCAALIPHQETHSFLGLVLQHKAAQHYRHETHSCPHLKEDTGLLHLSARTSIMSCGPSAQALCVQRASVYYRAGAVCAHQADRQLANGVAHCAGRPCWHSRSRSTQQWHDDRGQRSLIISPACNTG